MPLEIKRLNEALIEIDGRVRVERGPRMLTAVATEELLSNEVTASHYKVGGLDKLGKVIVLGEEMTYLDWLGKHVFHLYEYCVEDWTGPNTFVLDADGNKTKDAEGKFVLELGPAWRRRGMYEEEVLAVAAAVELATQGAA